MRQRLAIIVRRMAPWARRLLMLVGVVLLLAVLTVVTVLVVPPSRESLARRGLEAANGMLPGDLTLGRIDWPTLGRLSLTEIQWTVADTVLADVDSLSLDLDLAALRRRDVVVNAVELTGARFDLPAIRRHLPAPPAETHGPTEPPADREPPIFPRPGSLPPAPSVAVRRLHIADVHLALAPDQVVHLDTLHAACDLRPDRAPTARMALTARPWNDLGLTWRLQAEAQGDTLTLAMAPLTVTEADRRPAMSRLPLAGRLTLLLSDLAELDPTLARTPSVDLRDLAIDGLTGCWTLSADLNHQHQGRLELAGACPSIPWSALPDSPRSGAWADSLDAHWQRLGGPRLTLAADLAPPTGTLLPFDIAVDGSVTLPGPAALSPLLPPQLDVADLGIVGIDLDADLTNDQARLRLDLGRTAWLQRAVILAHGDSSQVHIDTLALALPGLDLAASGSLTHEDLRLDARVDIPDASLLQRWRDPAVAGLELSAGLAARVTGRPDSPRLRLGLHADTPDAGVVLAGDLNTADLATAPSASMHLDSLAVRLAEHRLATVQPCTLIFDAADTTLAVRSLAMAGDLGSLTLEADATADSVLADLGLDLEVAFDVLRPWLQPAVQPLLPSGAITLHGRTSIHGPLTTPLARGDLRVALADNPELASLSAVGAVVIERRLDADLAINEADTTLLRLVAGLPRPQAPAQPDTVDIALLAEGADLSRLQPLLPPGVDLEGTLDADPRLVGLLDTTTTAPDLDLSGGLSLSDLRLGLPDGSWLAMAGQAAFSGSTLEPVVQGGLRIEGGLLRVPEPPPILLPDKGQALLWQVDNTPRPGTTAALDTLEAAGSATPPILPELDLSLTAPGGLWIRGQGLDVELAGDLVLRLRAGLPALEGELQAVQGTMRQLGHVFHLERGRVVFYADEGNLDPELDLELAVKVDGVAVSILLTGTANEPHLDLTSDADLSHGDIMALLLFGKTSDELDDGQAGFLAQRAAQLAAASGSVALQERLARELGADVLTIAPSGDRDDTTALTLGKYLSPRVLVRYEQLLSEESAFYVHLDYTLVQGLKLHTQVSQGEASGAALRWEKSW